MLKEFFQQQPTSLLLELTGGVPVVEFLNVELPPVRERRLDLMLVLEDETLPTSAARSGPIALSSVSFPRQTAELPR